MPGYIVHEQAQMQCPHGGTVTATAGQAKVKASQQALDTSSSQITVSGCPFQVPIGTGTKPQPCVTVQWTDIAGRVKISGTPAILQSAPSGSGEGICQSADQIPAGP